ncbi:basic amino acid ABC transporter substrate-binding protein [Anaerosinus gibii]|uniref:Basic amino acid ABC transporter substrate-binding protein n=1 Tax=Selenobaculum gibii TaxID=3054208 RepID=A0A9Y2EQT5_9FIRM|nr:basic amino acid ABC transporter substrate-binding protein [Selenobaculum gbiensis]WIW70367.1 basic amino acid ABC transporter substrate-binding protein [Selenobaculum gbiensis]
MSRKLISLLMLSVFVVMALVTGCGSDTKKSDAKVLRIGTNADFAPFEFQDVDGKEYVGFDMDLARAIAKEMGYQADIQNVNFDGLIPALEAGNIDMIISGMTVTEERKQKVAFSKPYYQSGLTFVVRNDNDTIKSFKDLEGKTIAVQIGTTGANKAREIKDATVKEFNSSADTFLELKAGGVDAVVNDRPVNDYFLAQGGTKDAKTFPEILTAEDYGIAISKKNPELAKQIDEALEKLQANGEYDKIFEKWFGKQVK